MVAEAVVDESQTTLLDTAAYDMLYQSIVNKNPMILVPYSASGKWNNLIGYWGILSSM